MLAAVWSWVPPTWLSGPLSVLVLILGILLILLVLIQRGKGGGLAGAFGGVGGSSAFGSRAGDLFTRITIGMALAWIVLTMLQVYVMQQGAQLQGSRSFIEGAARPSPVAPGEPGPEQAPLP